MNDAGSGTVLVQVIEAEEGREIGWGANLTEKLGRRAEDVRRAIAIGARTVADSLHGLPDAQSWKVREVSASFGVILTAETGAILTKASAGATFDVSITYQRDE